MPNWCYNSMLVKGSDNVKDELFRQLTYPAYQHEKEGIVVLCGYPETKDRDITMREYHNLVKLAGDTDEKKSDIYLENVYPCLNKENYYAERINEWGTGREAFCTGEPDKDSYAFETAWSPAEYAIDKIAEQYPELEIEYSYDECGMGFCGKKEYSEGECISSITEDDYDGDYTKAYIDLFDVEEYWRCEDCGHIESYEMDEECYECGSTNIKMVHVGSKDDKLFENRY